MARLISKRQFQSRPLYCLTAVLLFSVNVQASLINSSVSVSFSKESLTDTVTVTNNQEIIAGDATRIGSGLLLPGEFIDIAASTITYHLQGGGADVNAPPGDTNQYKSPGFTQGDTLVFSNLKDISNLTNPVLSTVSMTLTDVIGANLNFVPKSTLFSLNLDQLGVKYLNDGLTDFGTITFNLTFESGPAPTVPIPSSLLLMFSGLTLIFRNIACKRKNAMQA